MSNKLEEKKALLDELDNVLRDLEYKENSLCTVWEDSGETEQCTSYDGELKWEDEEKTIPKMKPVYKEVIKKYEDLDEYTRKRLDAVRKIRETLEKLI